MAVSDWPTGHALAVKHFQRELDKEALKRTSVLQYISTDGNNIIHVKEGPDKEAGDQVTFGIRMQLQGRGVVGNATQEGKEEKLSIFTDAVVVDQLRHAVRTSGQASEQRVPFSTRMEGLDGLADWHADRLDTSFFIQAGGAPHVYSSDTAYSGLQAATDPITAGDTDHVVYVEGATTEAGVASASASATFKLSYINRSRTRAQTISPIIKPIMMRGERYYVCFLHPLQVEDLRNNTSTGQWADIQLAAMKGGDITGNPIFTGALGVYNKTILVENERVPTANTTPSAGGMYRAIFCGTQAVAIAFGMGYGPSQHSWVEELFDYKNQLGVSAGKIFGAKKVIYNSKAYGSIIIPTYTTYAS